jgi:hypothetical protein
VARRSRRCAICRNHKHLLVSDELTHPNTPAKPHQSPANMDRVILNNRTTIHTFFLNILI